MGVLDGWKPQEFYPGSRHPIGTKDSDPKWVDPERWDANPKYYDIGGEKREFFTVGALGKALGGRKPVTIRKWETEGVIPKPTFRRPSHDPRGQRRLYTRDQVEGMVRIAREEGVLAIYSRPIKQTDFTKRVTELFSKLAAEEAA